MPPKGWTAPPGWKRGGSKAAPQPPDRCAQCGKMLPAMMLRGFLEALKRLRADLSKGPEPGDESAVRRSARLQVLNACSTVDLLLEDAETLLCAGHEPKKRGPRPRQTGDPSVPPGVVPRKKRALRAVPDAS